MRGIFLLIVGTLLCAHVAMGNAVSNEWKNSEALLLSLEKSFSSIKTVQTKFTQEKTLRVFARTIEMKGNLLLENPGRLAWRINSPIRYVLILDGNYALQWDEETRKVQKTKTTGDPVFEEVLGQIEKWFSGKFSLLAKDYNLNVLSHEPLEMAFIPKPKSLVGKAIKRVTVSVRDDRKYVEAITIEDVSGDLTKIMFHDTVLNKPIATSEWKVN